MKTLIKIFILAILLNPVVGQAQINPYKIKKPQRIKLQKDKKIRKIQMPRVKTYKAKRVTATATANTKLKELKGCKSLSNDRVNQLLNKLIANNLRIKLDRETSYIRFNNATQKLHISDYKVDKPGHNWLYYISEINSTGAVATFDREERKFMLNVSFEGEKSEIKGKCPGCMNRWEDTRAPDINWLGDRVMKIELKPVVYKNSLAFEVTDVKLGGHFMVNGPVQAFFPGLITFFERTIMNVTASQAKRVMNTSGIKAMMANAFKDEITNLGFTVINSAEIGEGNLYICNR